jgi:hypothetical protein
MIKLTNKQKILVIFAVVAIVLLIVVAAISLLSKDQAEEEIDTRGKVDISNITEYTEDKPQNTYWLNSVEEELLRLVRVNSGQPNLKASDITDAAVRKDSFNQTYNGTTDINAVDFIVDVPSMKQSYRAHYEWASKTLNEANSDPNRGMNMLKCPMSNQLKYGEFKCTDAVTTETGWPYYDDILEYMPYYSDSYYIYAGRATGSKPVVLVHIGAVATDTSLTKQYTDEALNQIKAWSKNPTDYDIKYEYDGVQ